MMSFLLSSKYKRNDDSEKKKIKDLAFVGERSPFEACVGDLQARHVTYGLRPWKTVNTILSILMRVW